MNMITGIHKAFRSAQVGMFIKLCAEQLDYIYDKSISQAEISLFLERSLEILL